MIIWIKLFRKVSDVLRNIIGQVKNCQKTAKKISVNSWSSQNIFSRY